MEAPFDYFFNNRTNPRTIEALKGGPLASALEAYARRLHEDGYATHSGFVQLRLLGCFNRWPERKGLTREDVDAATIERYLDGRAQSRKLRRGDSAALFRLLTMLRPEGSGLTASPPTPYHRAEHSALGSTPLLRWQRDIEHVRQLPPATDLRRLFFYRLDRLARRDCTFLLHNRFYEAPPHLPGQTIEVRFDPLDAGYPGSSGDLFPGKTARRRTPRRPRHQRAVTFPETAGAGRARSYRH